MESPKQEADKAARYLDLSKELDEVYRDAGLIIGRGGEFDFEGQNPSASSQTIANYVVEREVLSLVERQGVDDQVKISERLQRLGLHYSISAASDTSKICSLLAQQNRLLKHLRTLGFAAIALLAISLFP